MEKILGRRRRLEASGVEDVVHARWPWNSCDLGTCGLGVRRVGAALGYVAMASRRACARKHRGGFLAPPRLHGDQLDGAAGQTLLSSTSASTSFRVQPFLSTSVKPTTPRFLLFSFPKNVSLSLLLSLSLSLSLSRPLKVFSLSRDDRKVTTVSLSFYRALFPFEIGGRKVDPWC